MKVVVAHFTAECNEHISHEVDLDEFLIEEGEKAIELMHIGDVFKEEGIQLIPSIYASLHPNGMIKREAFEFVCNKILDVIRDNLSEIDGIYLQLHGASGILDLDEVSGEHTIVSKIREVVGKYMPIALVMDPHGNLTETLGKQVNIVRCYRESPHSDQIDTEKLVAYKLIGLLRQRREMTPIVRKLAIMVGGERSVSAKEPIKSINQMLDEIEKDPRVYSSSYHVGYIRHDDDKLGAAVVVVPNTPEDIAYCEQKADEIATYAWNHRSEFKFSGNYDEPKQSLLKAIAFHSQNLNSKTAVITDSGDNCGAGGYGQNTIMLREVLTTDLNDKKVLIAGITDFGAYEYLSKQELNQLCTFKLGVEEDEHSKAVEIEGRLSVIGKAMYGLTNSHIVGNAYVVSLKDKDVDIIVLNRNVQYGNMKQFNEVGIHFHDYDIVIVKMGYLDTYLIPETAYHIMALTDGPTIQRSERIPFKRIHRPMWPMDEMDKLEYIK